jgi:hypothetical protein
MTDLIKYFINGNQNTLGRPSAGFSTTSAWARFLQCPLTAIQTHMKKGKGYNEITIY